MEVIRNIVSVMMDLQAFSFTPGTTPGTETVTNVNLTSSTGMSPTLKTFYNKSLLENARENMVFDQFGKRTPISNANTAEWRKFNTFKPALTNLSEGVIPSGETFGLTSITASVTQHGKYVPISDRLEMESFDDIIYGCTEEMGSSEGETYDLLTRNIISAGNSVWYAPKISGGVETAVTSRADLTRSALLTPKLINKAATWLKKNKAPTINGKYIALINPSVSYDIRENSDWKDYHKYSDTTPIFRGEIGELHGVRFIESNAAKIVAPSIISDGLSRLTVDTDISASTSSVVIKETLTASTPSTAIPVYVNGVANTITDISTSGSTTTLTLGTAVSSVSSGAIICGTGAGKDGSAVYLTLFLGRDAYGIIEPEGEGQEMIIKTKEQAGGPLNQFSTVGYKFCHGAKILYQERLLRVETSSDSGDVDESN